MLLHYSVNTKITANQKCHACRICLNSLLCFTTTDSLTWQRTGLHKKLFNSSHMTLWSQPTKAINTKRIIPRNWIEETLMDFSERLRPFQNSERQNSNCRKPRCRFTNWGREPKRLWARQIINTRTQFQIEANHELWSVVMFEGFMNLGRQYWIAEATQTNCQKDQRNKCQETFYFF